MHILFLFLLPLITVDGVPSEGCGSINHHHPGNNHKYHVTVEDPLQGSVTRDYILHLPATWDSSNTESLPLVLDYHGWTGSADDQVSSVPWAELADTEGFLYVSMDGMSDVHGGGSYGSWNVSATQGPLGLTCDPTVAEHTQCYTSCGDCSYLENSCDWTSCHDDVTYTETVLYDVLAKLCVDTDQIHVSGMSNGGMFIWTRWEQILK